MTLRSFVLTAHQWMGLGGGLFLAVLGLTGTVLVFEGAIDRALHPATSYVAAGGARLSLDSLVAVARANRPGTAIVGATLPQRPDRSLELAASTGRSLFVNPYSGAFLGERDRRGSLRVEVLRQSGRDRARPKQRACRRCARMLLRWRAGASVDSPGRAGRAYP